MSVFNTCLKMLDSISFAIVLFVFALVAAGGLYAASQDEPVEKMVGADPVKLVELPRGITNLQELGNYWVTFDFNNERFLLNKYSGNFEKVNK